MTLKPRLLCSLMTVVRLLCSLMTVLRLPGSLMTLKQEGQPVEGCAHCGHGASEISMDKCVKQQQRGSEGTPRIR